MNVVVDIIVLLFRLTYCYLESLIHCFVSPRKKSIRGKVVLVTGAGRGIGRAIAVQLAANGAKMALWDVDATTNAETSRIIAEAGGTAFSYVCDVTSVKAVADAAAAVRRDLGVVDILVNNAGVAIGKNILQSQEREIRRTLEINLVAHFWTVKQFLPDMITRKSGHVVTISSMAGISGGALLTDYCASKFGVSGFTEALAEDLRRMKATGISVTTVHPMFVSTNLVTDLADRIEVRDRFTKNMLTSEDVALSVVDGILRNKRYVFVPGRMVAMRVLNALLPNKARAYILDFLDVGFFEKSKTE